MWVALQRGVIAIQSTTLHRTAMMVTDGRPRRFHSSQAKAADGLGNDFDRRVSRVPTPVLNRVRQQRRSLAALN